MGNPTAFNNRGQVVSISNMAGDLTFHPFLWSEERGLQDLGTLGGDSGETNWINNSGDVAGKADLPGPPPQSHDAVLWRKHGAEKIDLSVLPGDSCANAYYVNSRGQVVGTSENSDLCRVPTGEHAFLWEDGGPMVDLNTLIPPGSSLQLTFAFAIDDEGTGQQNSGAVRTPTSQRLGTPLWLPAGPAGDLGGRPAIPWHLLSRRQLAPCWADHRARSHGSGTPKARSGQQRHLCLSAGPRCSAALMLRSHAAGNMR